MPDIRFSSRRSFYVAFFVSVALIVAALAAPSADAAWTTLERLGSKAQVCRDKAANGKVVVRARLDNRDRRQRGDTVANDGAGLTRVLNGVSDLRRADLSRPIRFTNLVPAGEVSKSIRLIVAARSKVWLGIAFEEGLGGGYHKIKIYTVGRLARC